MRTVGVDALASEIGTPSKSLIRMFGSKEIRALRDIERLRHR
jgi:hypothetical protein